MTTTLIYLCVVLYVFVGCFIFLKLDKTTPSDPTVFERSLVATFWPFSIVLAGIVVLFVFWFSRKIEQSKR